MENHKYLKLHNYPKITNQTRLYCANQGQQESYAGHAIFDNTEKFQVIQARKGKIRKDDLTYVLLYKRSEIMLRIDLVGATHKGIPTPHVHIFDHDHCDGFDAIPLSSLKNYNPSDDIVISLFEFLKYNNFETRELLISSKKSKELNEGESNEN
ncbi:DUF6978 family protein [Lentilactobacillus raoultii]|uniref:DUF6978 family protein n=1 Tax=Lentilactobacillus raoultii TaxID=1987503 RepID=A0ABW3PPF0_9LACO|nr:hypothetical protein [Lentilactobacillus raoultii]